MKPALLMLVHRIPYPPNKGDKVRSFNVLAYLSRFYSIHLAAFVDDSEDWVYQDKLASYCQTLKLLPLSKKRQTLLSLSGLFRNQALTLPYYANTEMQHWVNQTLDQFHPENIFVYSSSMAQYVQKAPSSCRRIMDFVDVDSHKWQQYAVKKPFWIRWLYQRESTQLLKYEDQIAASFDYSYFVSDRESDFFNQQTNNKYKDRVGYFFNGVDSEFFSPEHDYPASPYQHDKINIVFTGAMDYWPNIDAVYFFVQQVLPELDQRYHFYIVGSNPSKDVRRLGELGQVTVTGRVDDIRLYIHYASVIVAPLTIARGIQNKVLEAMAMSKLVVCSSQALEGISANNGEQLLLADTVADYLSCFESLGSDRYEKIATNARSFVKNVFSWDSNLKKMTGRFK